MALTFDDYLDIPRVNDIRASADGRRLVGAVARLAAYGRRFRTSLWSIDPSGAGSASQLTRSAKGEGPYAIGNDGSVFFVSQRSDGVDEEADPEAGPGLWHLPPRGEAERLVRLAGGIDAVALAAKGRAVVIGGEVFRSQSEPRQDAALAKRRKDRDVQAALFEGYPMRYWDQYLGPRDRHLFLLRVGLARPPRPVDLTPDAGGALVDVEFDVAPDGSFVVTGWIGTDDRAQLRSDLVRIETVDGRRATLTAGDADFSEPRISPDGRFVVAVRDARATPAGPGRIELWLLDLQTASWRNLTPSLDRIPHSPRFALDGQSVYFLADDDGVSALYSVPTSGGPVGLLDRSRSWSTLAISEHGPVGVRSAIDAPPHVGRFDAPGIRSGRAALRLFDRELRNVKLPGRLERLSAETRDGKSVSSWLLTPIGDRRPHPMVVWVHGGPVAAFAGWAWRWNPQLLAEHGYAVLMPDPALSTGYGYDWITRGWGAWGKAPYEDVLAAVDGALERPDLDSSRTALMGGSFGGYMANWVAGHTDRFKAIVTHAATWDMRGFHGVTDVGSLWERELGDPYEVPEGYAEWSPSAHIADIRTPMLVIHGERDYRVPISEALRLWTDLARHSVPAKFLYFPDENHWILKPQNARLWYETVFAFLDHHVLGKPWERPPLV